MTEDATNPGNLDDEMSEYMETFLDETEEQLDDLVETMLLLEKSSSNEKGLNEAFRLVHSIKGAAGMMGLDHMTVLTHHLENRFERFRSGTEQLDEATMNLVLRCIDFLRQCSDRLRDGKALGSPGELLSELKELEDRAVAAVEERRNPASSSVPEAEARSAANSEPAQDSPSQRSANIASDSVNVGPIENAEDDAVVRIVVGFRAGLPLADLKAQLIVSRLTAFGQIRSCDPPLDALVDEGSLSRLEIQLVTGAGVDDLRSAADVEGVDSIDVAGGEYRTADKVRGKQSDEGVSEDDGPEKSADPGADAPIDYVDPPDSGAGLPEPATVEAAKDEVGKEQVSVDAAAKDGSAPKVAGTMRVNIDRLDHLMNLAGELVVNRARFVQISEQISPDDRKATSTNRIREFCDNLRQTIDGFSGEAFDHDDRQSLLGQLRSGLQLMDEHARSWEKNRHHFEEYGEAIDQLSRVSQGLQQGVLDTRMVPVGPLFNRFKRVVRDLSKERGKQVNLQIRGEKTELDKRMIDELVDPLVHLVRNSIDHGLESPQQRVEVGKPEVGTITLEAVHSGNNVFVHVRDDGRGIDVDKIKSKLVGNRVLSETAAAELSREQALDYIWHPGFSTAKEITDISGRGVGMDVVQNRVRQLNGNIEVESVPLQGTHFRIRLPLTLAIINCLLVRLRGVVFSMPIDDVREIVSVRANDVVSVQGRRAFEVRGEFVPLVEIGDIFAWHDVDYGHGIGQRQGVDDEREVDPAHEAESDHGGGRHEDPVAIDPSFDVVILRASGKVMGLRVNELLGSQDMVIKSLSENFVDIRGLSGASILGDGRVSLMLDIGTMFHMAIQASLESGRPH